MGKLFSKVVPQGPEPAELPQTPQCQSPSEAVPKAALPQAVPEVESAAEQPAVLHVLTLSKCQREKVKRIVTPKPTTGNLEVPKNVFEMWQTPKGKEQLLAMWCKSGGVKDGCCKYLVQHRNSYSFKFPTD